MSFSYQIKKELAKFYPEQEDCYLSELSAILRTTAEIKLLKGKFAILINTEVLEVYQKINTILEKMYGFSVELNISEEDPFNTTRYEIEIPAEKSLQVLQDCGIIYRNEVGQIEFYKGIDKYMVMEPCCKQSYLRGAFIGCGTTSIVLSQGFNTKLGKNTSGYHLEFVFMSEVLAQDFCHLLSEFNIISKKVKRKNNFVVYLKEAQSISDVLALMGATSAVLSLQNEMALRSIRNEVNRQSNCETGNITKLVNASLKQVEAIKIIQDTIGLEELPLPLQEVAMLRLANQEESLDNLVKLSGLALTKSGLRHRFTKIVEIAKSLSE